MRTHPPFSLLHEPDKEQGKIYLDPMRGAPRSITLYYFSIFFNPLIWEFVSMYAQFLNFNGHVCSRFSWGYVGNGDTLIPSSWSLCRQRH